MWTIQTPWTRRLRPFAILLTFLLSACQHADQETDSHAPEPEATTMKTTTMNTPPIAAKRPHQTVLHGQTRIDPYHWLRDDDRKDPEVIDYLDAENAWFERQMSDTDTLQESLYQEMTARLKEDESSVPQKDGDYWYYYRYEEGKDYKIHARKYQSLDAAEQIILDENVRAEGEDYYSVNSIQISDDHRLMAWTEDTVSRRLYTIRIMNLDTGEMLGEDIPNASGAMAFAADNKTLFYTIKDEQTLLPFQVYRHALGTDISNDTLIYEEKDNTFYTSVSRGKSKDYIYISIGSTISSEYRLLPADQPKGEFELFLARQDHHEYQVTDLNGRFYVLTNQDAINFKIMSTDQIRNTSMHGWQEFVAHRDDVLLSGMTAFRDRLAVNLRINGMRNIHLIPFDDGPVLEIDSDEPAYTMYLDDNVEVDAAKLRYGYTSLTTPYTIYDYDLTSGERTLLKQTEVIGDFDSANYQTARLMVPARDGTDVPISVVHHRKTPVDGTAPLLVYAYGSYGSSTDPSFNSSRLSLLDRGYVFAIAHVRGGQEMGRKWYDDGKMFNKRNTFNDFVDVTRGLIERRYGDPKRTYAYGGSAGGLLMGVIINEAPELYHGVVAAVPFVDVINTMLDESIPLTTGEFNEWGNPKIKDQYEYILSYSPYDQVQAQDYPNLLITTGLHDSQVQYFEPAKWIAKLRDMKTDDNLLLMYTDMEAGHGGASGRYQRYRDVARMFAFFLKLSDMNTGAQ